jgi:Asp-tRNA(Asn)/Glu-tRNA(Gln) amidotransferase C subunit
MLHNLDSQLHFVRQIQACDTTGIPPLRALRDETKAAEDEAEVGMDALRDAFEQEEWKGEFWRRPVRRKDAEIKGEEQDKDWDALDLASRKVGRYFVVDKIVKEEES